MEKNIESQKQKQNVYKVEIKTVKGTIIIYLENLLKLEEEINKYSDHESVKATKILVK